MAWMGMDFGFEPEKAVVFGPMGRWAIDIDIPLGDIPVEMLKLFMGEDAFNQMYWQQECNQRWEDDGGAYL